MSEVTEPATGQPCLGPQWLITVAYGITAVEFKDRIIFARLGERYPDRILRAFWRYLGAG